MPQSMEDLQWTPVPEVIIIRLRTVSIGQEASPETTVTAEKSVRVEIVEQNIRENIFDQKLTPSEKEGKKEAGLVAEEQRLGGVVETEVESSVDEDTNAGDGESSVQTGNSISGESLLVNIEQTVELSLAVFA